MNDSFRTNIFVRYPPETIGCACIFLSARQLEVRTYQQTPDIEVGLSLLMFRLLISGCFWRNIPQLTIKPGYHEVGYLKLITPSNLHHFLINFRFFSCQSCTMGISSSCGGRWLQIKTLVFFFQIPLPTRPPWWELFGAKLEDLEVWFLLLLFQIF